MSISQVLQRAKAAAAAAAASAPAAAGADPWRIGSGVELDVAGVVTRGRTWFEGEDGWIYWFDHAGDLHASPAKHLTRTTRTT